jgi:Flp pilus assembly protein TadG
MSPGAARPAGRSDHGAVLVEFAGIFPVALVVILISVEALLAGTSVERVENATRTGARVASQQHSVAAGRAAALDAMPGWLGRRSVDGRRTADGGFSLHVRAKVPLLWPGAPLNVTVDRTVHMPAG